MTDPIVSASRTRPRWQVRLATVIVAVIANLVVWGVSKAAGVSFEVAPFGQDRAEVPVFVVVGQTLFSALVAWGLLALLERFAPRRSWTIWLIIAAVVFALFFVNPLAANADVATVVVLELMHLVEAVIVIAGFAASRPARAA